MDEPVKNSIWNYLIPLHYLEQVSSILERRGVEVSLTSHYTHKNKHNTIFLLTNSKSSYIIFKAKKPKN